MVVGGPGDEERRPVRVLRVIARLNLGGPAHHVAILTERLPAERYRTILVAGRVGAGEEELPSAVRAAGPDLVRLAALRPEIAPLHDLRALWALIRLVRRHRPEIVHTHTAKAGQLGRLAAWLAPGVTPIIVHTYHGHVLEGYFGPLKQAFYRSLERAMARVTRRLIGVSQATVDDLVRLRVAPRERFEVVPLGLDLDALLALPAGRSGDLRAELGLSDEEVLVVSMGRLVDIKRLDVLLEAVARARGAGAPLALALVGGGPLREELVALAARLDIGDHVRFLGYRTDVARILAGADVAALSSDNEGTPVALIEAAAAGLPLVATDVGGVSEVLTAGSGTLVASGDDEALGKALAGLAFDPGLRARQGAAARAHVASRYTAERLVRDIDTLYASLLAPS